MRRLSVGVLVGVIALLTGFVAAAAGVEGKQFGVTAFSLRTTRSVDRVEGPARVIENVPVAFDQAGGRLNGQLGGPDSLTGTVRFETEPFLGGVDFGPTRDPKDIIVTLPPGLIGDPMAVPRCSLTQLLATGEHCPSDTQ